MRSRASIREERELFAARETPAEDQIETCPSCAQRPAWAANRLPVCEVCFGLVVPMEKLEFWRSLDRAVTAPCMVTAVRAARARLVRATRVG